MDKEWPGSYVSISSEVFPFMREYDRWTTTTINAYTQPIVDRYLEQLEAGLNGEGFLGKVYIMASNGGTITPATARRFPVRMLESGPAAGVLMSAFHGRALDLANVLSFDMGGTTAKGSLIQHKVPLRKYDMEVARIHEFKRGSGLPVRVPAIDMIEIGAGGGSIAEIDERGVIRVGPRSAGADPGPASYGRDGDKPTLTDANLVLGYLDPGFFLGGR
jgi:N-methylhydantoinase A